MIILTLKEDGRSQNSSLLIYILQSIFPEHKFKKSLEGSKSRKTFCKKAQNDNAKEQKEENKQRPEGTHLSKNVMETLVSRIDNCALILSKYIAMQIHNKKPLNMQSLFPWNSLPSDYKEQLTLLPLKGAIPIKKLQTSQGFQNLIVCHPHQLQLRGHCFVVVRMIDNQVLSFFECQPTISVVIRRMITAMDGNLSGVNKKEEEEILVQFHHQGEDTYTVSFFCNIEAHKVIEFYRSFAKTYTTHLDFHSLFKPLRKIGQGLTSTVYQVNRLIDNKTLAVKAFKKSSYFASSGGKGYHAFLQEFKILTECSHENICRFEGVYETENTVYIVQEYYQRSLSKLLMNAEELDRTCVVFLMENLLRGVNYLHSKGIFHRDIKLDNIMLRRQGNSYRPVIIDLGMAHYINNPNYLFDKCGSPGYIAPEVFVQGARDPRGDVFSLGIIFYILLFKKSIFIGENRQEVILNNRNGNLNIDYERLDKEDKLIKDLLLKMLEVDKEKRLTSEEALSHLIFRKEPDTPKTFCGMTNEELYME